MSPCHTHTQTPASVTYRLVQTRTHVQVHLLAPDLEPPPDRPVVRPGVGHLAVVVVVNVDVGWCWGSVGVWGALGSRGRWALGVGSESPKRTSVSFSRFIGALHWSPAPKSQLGPIWLQTHHLRLTTHPRPRQNRPKARVQSVDTQTTKHPPSLT